MDNPEIPEDVQTLLESIETHEQLEVLLLLFKDQGRHWSLVESAAHLRISDEAIAEALLGLAAQRLIEELPGALFRYAGGPQARHESVERLARLHDERRLELIKLMSANAIERVRNAAIKTFADSFVLRRRDG